MQSLEEVADMLGMLEAIFNWSGKVSMHDVIDLCAWHFVCNDIATPGLARALAW